MDIPDFLKPATTVRISRPGWRAAPPHAMPASGLGLVTPGSQILPLPDLRQEQDHWCWAAVGVNVARFYDPRVTLSQCQVVNIALHRSDCCSQPAASDVRACDVDGYLELALKITQNFSSMTRRSLTFGEVQAQLNKDHVACCRVAWIGGGAHFLSLKGWIVGSSGVEYIEVCDPIFLSSRIAFSQFPAGYQGGADWTHSYLTEHAPAAGGSAPPNALIPGSVSHPEAIGA